MIKISKKQAEKNKRLEKIKEKLPKVCVICGNTGNDLAHLLNKQLFPEYYTKTQNLVILCRDCHVLYDNNVEFRMRQIKLFKQVSEFDLMAARRWFKIL
jgi:5-methylcytosine-specific restriction endonuclease McrA